MRGLFGKMAVGGAWTTSAPAAEIGAEFLGRRPPDHLGAKPFRNLDLVWIGKIFLGTGPWVGKFSFAISLTSGWQHRRP